MYHEGIPTIEGDPTRPAIFVEDTVLDDSSSRGDTPDNSWGVDAVGQRIVAPRRDEPAVDYFFGRLYARFCD